jgi:hypothetical protein
MSSARNVERASEYMQARMIGAKQTRSRPTHNNCLLHSLRHRFQVREFVWDDQVAEKQRIELEEANVSEKELWTELLRLARTNFSEAYMVLTHLKVIRSFVESVLRYGLPAEYFGIAVKVGIGRSETVIGLCFSTVGLT